MKKRLSVLLAGLILSASVAMAASAPAAPVLSVVKGKIADGIGYTDGGTVFATDGLNVYCAFRAPGNTIKMVRSKDGGATWGGAHSIYTSAYDPQTGANGLDKVSLALSGDAAFPNQKIVHVVWGVDSPNGIYGAKDIYYSWADAANLDAWSTPLRLNGSLTDLDDPAIAVTKAGIIFVKGEFDGKLYLMTSSAHDAGFFTEPAMIPVSDAGRVAGDAELFVDSSNNLHLSYPYYANAEGSLAGIKYTRLPAGSSTWSNPVTVFAPSTAGANHSGLTAYDANNIYISTIQNGNLTFFSSSNGGSSWTKKVVFTKTSTLRTDGYSDITVNSSKAITIGSPVVKMATDGTELGRDTKIYRSTDKGVTWSAATTIPVTGNFISLGVDGNGKVGVLSHSDDNFAVDGEGVTYFSKEK